MEARDLKRILAGIAVSSLLASSALLIAGCNKGSNSG